MLYFLGLEVGSRHHSLQCGCDSHTQWLSAGGMMISKSEASDAELEIPRAFSSANPGMSQKIAPATAQGNVGADATHAALQKQRETTRDTSRTGLPAASAATTAGVNRNGGSRMISKSD